MNIDDLTLKQIKEITQLFSPTNTQASLFDNGMIGKYVIVRCYNAGVHAGILEFHAGRECVLTESRRLWYWKPANNKSFLSGVAAAGLHPDSKISTTLPRVHLTENCEILSCSDDAERSIRGAPDYDQ